MTPRPSRARLARGFALAAMLAAAALGACTFLAPAAPRVPPPSAAGRALAGTGHAAAIGGEAPFQAASAAWRFAGGALVAVGAAATAALLRRGKRGAAAVRHALAYEGMPSPEEWIERVRTIEGQRAVFDVTIPKPLGLVPANFPNRPGVGIAKINEDGNADKLNRRVLFDNEPGMWILEGDEVIAVNGVTVEGKDLSEVGPLVKESEGDSITLTLCRAYMAGPVKVLFMPTKKVATMKRGIEISNAAKVGVEEVSYSCKEGWCRSCWHTDAFWGTQFRACSAFSKKRPPPDIPRTIPMQWNNVMPMVLLNYGESQRVARERRLAKEARKAEREKEKAEAAAGA
uniref:PDZ domain-containing protein n=1 Tax=Alexandrium monilatum TaxID=311494 RepID=A0A7S4RJZ7_9DINO